MKDELKRDEEFFQWLESTYLTVVRDETTRLQRLKEKFNHTTAEEIERRSTQDLEAEFAVCDRENRRARLFLVIHAICEEMESQACRLSEELGKRDGDETK